MKNRIVLISLLALSLAAVSVPLSAEIGIRGGYMESNLKKSGSGLFENHYSGFYAGLFTDNRIIPMLHFGSGLDYYQSGSQVDDNNKVVLHYISVPLSLKAEIGPIHIFAGVQGAIRVATDLTIQGQSTPAEGYSGYDAGGFVGVGLKFWVIGAEAKYNWGFVDIKDGYKNNYLQAGLTVWF
jgi:Outer membrane protein beta-barrel domain